MSETVVLRLIVERDCSKVFACSGGYGVSVTAGDAVFLLLAGRAARVANGDEQTVRAVLAEELGKTAE